MHCVDLGESFPTDSYSNAYLLAKIGVDTDVNELRKNRTIQKAPIVRSGTEGCTREREAHHDLVAVHAPLKPQHTPLVFTTIRIF